MNDPGGGGINVQGSQRMSAPHGRSALNYIFAEDRLRGRDIIGIEQLSKEELLLVVQVANDLKQNKFDGTQTQFSKGQTLAMLFEKPSLRTRVTFEAGMTQLGGSAIYLEGQLGIRESVHDVAKNLDRWLDGIMARTFDHNTVLQLAENAKVPVINGLSDREHPCQAFADFLTLQEHKGKLEGLKLAFVGDGNNVVNSLVLFAAKIGMHFAIACPAGYEPVKDIWAAAMALAESTGSKITITHDPIEAVTGADAVYTDTWVSMGQEEESEKRIKDFDGFQVNSKLLSAAKSDAIAMHCLPAHRGYEITDDVLDGKQSVVFDQAENRLHAQKAVIALTL